MQKASYLEGPLAECWPFLWAFIGDLNLHLFFTSCLASLSKEEFLSPFTKCLEIRFSIKQVKREQWHESPCPGNWSQSCHFPLHCWIFNKTDHNICEIQRDRSVLSFYKILNNSFVMSSIMTTTKPISIVKLQNRFPHKTIEI